MYTVTFEWHTGSGGSEGGRSQAPAYRVAACTNGALTNASRSHRAAGKFGAGRSAASMIETNAISWKLDSMAYTAAPTTIKTHTKIGTGVWTSRTLI